MSNETLVRAGHTLWQAAGGYAAASTIVQEFANGDSHDAKQGLLLAGTALIGALLSFGKSQAVKAVVAVTGARKARAQAVIDAAVQSAIADYKAKESAGKIVADVARTVAVDVTAAPKPDPYVAS